MKKVSILGVLTGAVVDIVSSVLLGIPFAIYAISKVDFSHTPNTQMQTAIMAAMKGNMPLYLTQIALGLACSVLGGYIAAVIAKRAGMLNGGLSSFLCVSLGIFSMASGKETHPFFIQLLILLASPACGVLGGFLRMKQKPDVSISQ